MARYTGPKCKLCRREGLKLFLKGIRCDTPKCALERRQYPPGPRTWRRQRITAYGQQLREKQKVKRYYGLLERQFRNYFARAERGRGNTGENLLLALELRLDSVVANLGFASSHSAARQLIRHGHIAINGRRTTVPAQAVEPGDEITPVDKDTSRAAVQAEREMTEGRPVPAWLEVREEPLVGVVTRAPMREDVTLPVEEQLIVELLSK